MLTEIPCHMHCQVVKIITFSFDKSKPGLAFSEHLINISFRCYQLANNAWYRYVHSTPEDALVAAQALNCKVMIPWGYGNNSWKMGEHSSHSPLLRLLKMHKAMNSPIPLHILNEGEEVTV
jgi:L-ascorbate metabolism protein UlaG (beta-lactamase superfamily)